MYRELPIGVGSAEKRSRCFLNTCSRNGCTGFINDRDGKWNWLLGAKGQMDKLEDEDRKENAKAAPMYAIHGVQFVQRH